MSNPFESSFQFTRVHGARPRDLEGPLRILVLGNYSGNGSNDSDIPIAERPIKEVDIDNFDELLRKKRPTISLPSGDAGDAAIEIEIDDMDNFHPDSLYQRLDVFNELHDLRKQLLNPSTFADAAARLTIPAPSPGTGATEPPGEQSQAIKNQESEAELLDRLLGGDRQTESPARGSGGGVQSLINDIVQPHIVAGADPRQDDYIQSVDAAIAAQMRVVLHDESFQTLSSSWAGLHYLVSSITGTIELKVFVWDVTREQLQAAAGAERLEDSLLFKRLVTQRDQEPWSMLVLDGVFGSSADDLSLLSQLGAIAACSGGPLLASASPELMGAESWTDELSAATDVPGDDHRNWQLLRQSPVASWIGLSAPRFLLRMPFGASTDPIESFKFEEVLDAEGEHESFLWGASSFFCATLLGQSFLQDGWQMNLGSHLELDDFPMVTYNDHGEKKLRACAESFLAERTADSILEAGIMPLLSYKNRNAIRLWRFQSIANPPTALKGPWS